MSSLPSQLCQCAPSSLRRAGSQHRDGARAESASARSMAAAHCPPVTCQWPSLGNFVLPPSQLPPVPELEAKSTLSGYSEPQDTVTGTC